MSWSTGNVIAERYTLEAPLRQGGMGALWIARHKTLGSELVLKQIDPELLGTEAAVQRFTREAKVVAGLRSPHIVQVFDHGLHQGVPFIAMELLDGESLAERLERRGKLSPVDTLRVVSHIARALTKAHDAGVVHRDLKPDNVFLIRNEDEEIAKVIDFGIAKSVDDAATEAEVKTQTGTLIGTPHYMSPEQARARQVDHRTDLWALGVLAYECMTGARPFFGKSVSDVLVSICSDPIPVPSSVAPVPDGFDDWFRRAVRREPTERFQSAREMVRVLRPIVLGVEDPEDVSGTEWRVSTPELHTAPTIASPESFPAAPVATDTVAATPEPAARAISVDTTTFDGIQRRPESHATKPASAPPARRRRRVLEPALAAVALTVVAVALWLGRGERTPSGDAPARTSSEPNVVPRSAAAIVPAPAASSAAPAPPSVAPSSSASAGVVQKGKPLVSKHVATPANSGASGAVEPPPKDKLGF